MSDPVISITMPASRLQGIVNLLATLPFGQVNEIIGEIVRQARAQTSPAAALQGDVESAQGAGVAQ